MGFEILVTSKIQGTKNFLKKFLSFFALQYQGIEKRFMLTKLACKITRIKSQISIDISINKAYNIWVISSVGRATDS